MRALTYLLALATVASAASLSHAAVLDGQTIGYNYLFPSVGDVIYDPGPIVVGPGVELPALYSVFSDVATADFSDTNILFDYYTNANWATGSFNGFRVWDINGVIPAFTSVTVNPATNMVGFSAANITFDADNIYVNWQGLAMNPSTIVSLDINGGGGSVGSVPEPTSIALLGMGGIGLVLARTRRRTANMRRLAISE